MILLISVSWALRPTAASAISLQEINVQRPAFMHKEERQEHVVPEGVYLMLLLLQRCLQTPILQLLLPLRSCELSQQCYMSSCA